jgi:hypothetical protein
MLVHNRSYIARRDNVDSCLKNIILLNISNIHEAHMPNLMLA